MDKRIEAMLRDMKSKRGTLTLGQLPQIALTLVFIAAIMVGGYLVLDGLGDSSTSASVATAVGNLTLSFDNIISYAPTWGTIIGVAVLIGIVVFGFAFARGKGYM